jgi:DNA helicase-2/ATP-dependent DNA helicase PcrA
MTDPSLLTDLNEAQTQAVTSADGRILVIAGPGTGKTLTIVRRIAWLVSLGVRPESILAVTFTNRAAKEMRERTEALLGDGARGLFIGTLHLLGLRIIRECVPGTVTLYNRDEQVGLLRSHLGLSAKQAEQAAENISRARNCLGPVDDETEGLLARYRAAMTERGAVDFDDLMKSDRV